MRRPAFSPWLLTSHFFAVLECPLSLMSGESPILPVSEAAPAPRAPMHLRYFSLLRSNANFRRLWLAQLVSELGDWFYSLAVCDLLLETTHSGKAVGWAIIIQLLPGFLMTPLVGPLADRFARRRSRGGKLNQWPLSQ